MGELVDKHTRVEHSLFIDDSGQYSSGEHPGVVGNRIAECAVDFVRMAEELKLELSLGQQGKSTLVTNNSRVAAIVVRRLAYRGVSIKVQNTARDLGVLLVGGAGRRTSIQHNRMQAAGPRFSRLRWLSRICYRARRVGRSNPYAVAFWGVEVLGLAPSQLKSFRSQAAASTGMTQAQRCATTAIAIGFGSDPAEDVLRRQLVSFFRYVRAKALVMAAVPGRFRVAWTEAKENQWNRFDQVEVCKWANGGPHCTAHRVRLESQGN